MSFCDDHRRLRRADCCWKTRTESVQPPRFMTRRFLRLSPSRRVTKTGSIEPTKMFGLASMYLILKPAQCDINDIIIGLILRTHQRRPHEHGLARTRDRQTRTQNMGAISAARKRRLPVRPSPGSAALVFGFLCRFENPRLVWGFFSFHISSHPGDTHSECPSCICPLSCFLSAIWRVRS